MTIEATLPTIAVFVFAALLWSTSGIIKNFVKHLKFVKANPNTPDPNWTGINKEAVKTDVILGTGIGILAFLVNAYNGQVTIDFSNVQTFIASLIPAYGLVALVDNTIVEPFLSGTK